MRWRMVLLLLFLLCLGVATALAEVVKVDPKIPAYRATTGVSGSIKSVGSETMNNQMALWSEGFRKVYPSVNVEIEGKGSGTAPPALIEGSAQFSPMSRTLKQVEIDKFEEKFGYPPLALPTSLDLLAVYVHRDNPIQGLTLAQLDAIFSRNRKRGLDEDITTWGALGLKGEWADKPISVYGRNSASGTYSFFKEVVLRNGDYKDRVKEQPGSGAVVQSIGSDRYGIGYSGIGFKTADVRAVPLARTSKSKCIEPTIAAVEAGDYPLSRFLYLVVNHKPGSPLDPLRREFLKYVFSQEGQNDVIKDGYYPLPISLRNQVLQSVGIVE